MKKYPMRILEGVFYPPTGEAVPLTDSKVICNGWGEIGSLRMDTLDPRSLPELLRLDWYSYAEDAFYTGEFTLPYEKLHQRFAEGYHDPVTGERRNFSYILVGLALEGYVSLWIVGGGATIELCHFKAERVDVPFESIFGTETEKSVYIEEAVESLQETNNLTGESISQPVPSNLWNLCHQRFKSILHFAGGDNSQLWLKTTDGQCQFFENETLTPHEMNLARIDSGFLFWETLNQRSWRAEFSLHDEEVFSAYDRLLQLAPAATIKVEFELGNKAPAIYICLKAEKWCIPLKPIILSLSPG